MEKPAKILSEEHKNILKVVNALNSECGKLSGGGAIDEDFFAKAIDFIKNYADKFHHAKEEDILFKAMKQNAENMHCDPTEQMLYEHDLGRNFVKGMEAALQEKNKEKLSDNAAGYARLLADHIFKEDSILYPMAEETLSEEAQNAMIEKFKEAEEIKFEKSAKEKYVSLADNLSKNQAS